MALTFLNILLGLTFLGRSVGMWLLFKVGFWETGTLVRVLILVLGALGFESTTLFFGGVVGLSPHFFFWGGGLWV